MLSTQQVCDRTTGKGHEHPNQLPGNLLQSMSSRMTPTLTEPMSPKKSGKKNPNKLPPAQRRCFYPPGVSNNSSDLTKTPNDPLSGKLAIPPPIYHRCFGPHSEVSSCNLITRITGLGNSVPKEVTSTQSVKVFKTRLAESHM